jgi:hypothetical protein
MAGFGDEGDNSQTNIVFATDWWYRVFDYRDILVTSRGDNKMWTGEVAFSRVPNLSCQHKQ